jgi:hypothetical protein
MARFDRFTLGTICLVGVTLALVAVVLGLEIGR